VLEEMVKNDMMLVFLGDSSVMVMLQRVDEIFLLSGVGHDLKVFGIGIPTTQAG
jgi:hypothetical protein